MSDTNTNNEVVINLRKLIELAREGHKGVLPVLRRALDERPELWERIGNIAQQVQSAWLELLGGQDLFVKESMGRHAASLRAELAGPDATALEKLQAERVVCLLFQLGYFELLVAKYEGSRSDRVMEYLHERCRIIDGRLQQALMNFAKIKKLLPGVVKVDVLVSGAIETKVSESCPQAEETQSEISSTRISVPANRIKDLLGAAQN